MTTALKRTDTQTEIQHYGQSLPPQQCVEHRAWIGVAVEALLDGYWDKRPDDVVKAEIFSDWMDGLQAFTPDEIRLARRAYLGDSKLCRSKPKVGDIRRIVLAERAKQLAALPKPVEPPREVATPEQRARSNDILAQAGFATRRAAPQPQE